MDAAIVIGFVALLVVGVMALMVGLLCQSLENERFLRRLWEKEAIIRGASKTPNGIESHQKGTDERER
jgi:hypothetical protein